MNRVLQKSIEAVDSLETAIIYLLEADTAVTPLDNKWNERPTNDVHVCIDATAYYLETLKPQYPKCPLVLLGTIHDREATHRLFSTSHNDLLTPAHELIGNRFESAMFNMSFNDEHYVKWHLFKRLNERPKRFITPAPSDRIFYETHYRYVNFHGKSEYYVASIIAYSPSSRRFFPVTKDAKDFHQMAKTCKEHDEQFALYASIVEDSLCPYFFHVTITSGISIKLYVWADQVKELFKIRDNPLTDTGRRRPIIHWVCEHLRRRPVNPGFAEIPEYLRGINEFDIQGMHIKIESPKRR